MKYYLVTFTRIRRLGGRKRKIKKLVHSRFWPLHCMKKWHMENVELFISIK